MRIKTFTAIVLAASTIGLCSAAYADQGFYVGGQAGYGSADYGSAASIGASTKTDDGIAGRIYAGYQFNPFFGLETGYTQFSDNKYKFKDTIFGDFNETIDTSEWDILAKAGMPFGCTGFRGDIKAGGAYVMASAHALGLSESHDRFAPVAGASVSYNFNKNLAADVSYLHTFGSDSDLHLGQSGNGTPDTNLVTVGISYLFA